ncbi:hypothetical protein [Schlesneria sp.]|uniref:hypothetical protein n=1 Tax=Schlesneria sp. TaxID=2762018 RepID=UPI002EDF2C4F
MNPFKNRGKDDVESGGKYKIRRTKDLSERSCIHDADETRILPTERELAQFRNPHAIASQREDAFDLGQPWSRWSRLWGRHFLGSSL